MDDNLAKVADKIPALFEGMAVVCAQSVQASHKKRLDRGEPKKEYESEAYKKIRSNKGRQTDYIDMQLSGTLYNNMITGVNFGDVVYGVRNVSTGKKKTDTSTIYNGQIKRNGHKDLLSINSDDAKKGVESATRFFTEKQQELFNV